MSRSRTYRIWAAMKRRCSNPKQDHYDRYGGRGIQVCERWSQFENFLSDMGESPVGMSIDRRDPNGNYEPGNCVWATQKEQANHMTSNRLVELDGKVQTVAQWAEELGIPAPRIYARLDKLKMPPNIALSRGKRSCKGMIGRGARTW